MKKVLIFLVILLGATIDVFSQRAILEADVPKLEKEAIAKIRRTFHIRRSTELFATVIFLPYNTGRDTIMGIPYFDTGQRVETYLSGLKFYSKAYEIFVYDKNLKYVYVINRILQGRGKYKKEYYLGKKEDYIVCQLLLEKRCDFVYNMNEVQFSDNRVMLCFKNGLIDLVYFDDDVWHSKQVCIKEDFSFLKPLIDEDGTE